MNITANVLFRVIDHVMNVINTKLFVGFKPVTVDRRALFNVLLNFSMERLASNVSDNHRADFAMPFEQAHNSGLTRSAPPFDLAIANALMHVPGFATYEGFVHFNFAGKFLKGTGLHGASNPVEHEPRALLSDPKRAVDLVRADTVLRIDDDPDRGQPLIKADGRVFHDCAYLNAELLFARFALPNPAGRKVGDFLSFAVGAGYTVRPSEFREKGYAISRVREVKDRLLKSLGECLCVHSESMIA